MLNLAPHPPMSRQAHAGLAPVQDWLRTRNPPVQVEGEFWTARQRQAHALHEISYRACFKPQLARYFIERLTRPGELVYDPFAGRGTTLVEAALLGRQTAANDLNPLATILARPRLEVPSLDAIADRLATLDLTQIGAEPDTLDLSMFYHPRTELELRALRHYLQMRQQAGSEDAPDRWLRMVATNRLTGHSSGFFSVYSLPPNQAISPERQRQLNARRQQCPDYRAVNALILRKSRQLQKNLTPEQRHRLQACAAAATFLTRPAQYTPELADRTVSLTVTSPPFLDVVQYADDNWLRCWFNQVDIQPVSAALAAARTLAGWRGVMSQVLAELYRITRRGGHVAFEVGEVRRGRVKLDEVIAPLGRAAGFQHLATLINRQRFTKTANIWGIANNQQGTNTNRIVVLRKPRTVS